MERIKTLRGFRDIYGEEVEKLRFIEITSRKYFELFGYKEIITPILENTGLFIRSIGDTTDIVEKEMFTFRDLSGESVTLRPEATAGIVRAYLETGMFAKERISKLFSIGPMFRHERPQKGRYREFRQIDVEVFGIDDPIIDAELIWMTSFILKEIGLEKKYTIEVNSVGCPVCRANFKNIIVDYFEAKEEGLCNDCKRRLHKNPLRIFDCKNTQCKEIGATSPMLYDNLCESCKIHFNGFLEYLNTLKLNVIINKRLVRGLDYYTRTVFEFISNDLGAQNAFLAGGRYNNLVEAMGGPNVPGIGFAIGMDRLAMLINEPVKKAPPQFFFAYLGDRAKALIIPFMERFIETQLKLSYLPQAKSLKSQMRYADALKADYVLIVGDDEIEKGIIVIRDMKRGNQINIPLDISSLIQNLSAFFEK